MMIHIQNFIQTIFSVDGKTAQSTMYYYKNTFMNLVSIDTGHRIVYIYIAIPKTNAMVKKLLITVYMMNL